MMRGMHVIRTKEGLRQCGILALALSFLIVFSGCTYSGRPVTVPKIEAMPVWRTEGPVTIGVDPYIQTGRQKEVFDDDLEKAKILPIYLLVKNNGDRPLSLRRRSEIPLADITLVHPDEYQISPVPTETVLRMLGRWPTSSTGGGHFSHESAYLIQLSPLLLPLIPFAIAGGLAEQKATDARITDYLDKEFKDVKLGKDDSTHGFVFFLPPHETLWSLKGKLVLHFVDETDGTDFVVRVPVSEQ
jgi:hypothetical protein